MTAHDLADELGVTETAAVEFKESASDRKKLSQTICAFANDLSRQGGGDLLVGVDDAGRPTGTVEPSDSAQLSLTEIRDDGKIIDRPSMTVTPGLFRGVPVLHIRVEASATPPVRFEGTIWVRPGPTTRRANRDDERVLTERRSVFARPFDTRPAHGTSIGDLDILEFQRNLLPAMVSQEVLDENERTLEQQMASLAVLDTDHTPTAMGVIVCGLNPTAAIPGAFYQFVRYEGEDVGSNVLDEQELRANAVDATIRMESILRGHLHTAVRETEGFRDESRPDYPVGALREAFMNAVIHRNYETSYAPIRVAWFRDRIEVTNPGGPFGQVRSDNFDRVNDYRNPSLAGAMKSLGYVNRFGRGIGRIQSALRTNGNPDAEFAVDDSSWLVTLRAAR